MNYPADHYLLLQLPYGLAKFLPVLLNRWQVMPEPDTVPDVFYDSAMQSPITFDDHEDFLASVQPEKQLKKSQWGVNQMFSNNNFSPSIFTLTPSLNKWP